MFRSITYWFEDHYVLGALIKTMLAALVLGLFIGFVAGGMASLFGYTALLKPIVCWTVCIFSGLGALWCVLMGLYALIVPKM